MTQDQFDALIAEAISLNIPCDPARWAWNRAHALGLHPELSGIPAPPPGPSASRNDWHDDLMITRDWLSRKA
jgi:hypothetical protein